MVGRPRNWSKAIRGRNETSRTKYTYKVYGITMTFGRLIAVRFVLAVLQHPVRAVTLLVTVAVVGWLSGYDVR